MQMVTCPNGGRCGSQKHHVGSKAYQDCLDQAVLGGGQGKRGMPTPTFAYQPKQDCATYIELMEMMRESEAYSAADSFVTKDMVIPDDMVQAYINDPDEVNNRCREWWGDDIREDIDEHSADILAKLGIDENDLCDGELDLIMEVAYDADESDIVDAVAKNMGPRTFSSSPITLSNKENAFRYATNGSEIGTDKWFDTLTNHYWSDLGVNGLVDPESLYAGEYHTTMEAQIRSILKDAIDKRGRAVESYEDLPDLSVVWSGSLADLSPHGKEHDRVCFVNPSLVASYSDTGAVGEPVKVDGLYDIAFNDDNRKWYHKYGSMSQVVDEMTSDKPILSSPGGEETLGKLASKASTVYDERPRLKKQYEH